MRSHTNEVQRIERRTTRRRRGMCCIQWKVDDIENEDDEVTRADPGRRH